MTDETSGDKLRLIEELRTVVDRQQQRRSGGESWSVAFAPDNSYFAWSCGHRIVTLFPWNASKNRPTDCCFAQGQSGANQQYPVVINCGDVVWSLAFGVAKNNRSNCNSPCRHYFKFSPPEGVEVVLAVGLNSGRIKIFTPTGKLITELIDHRDVVRDLRFSPDGDLTLLSASRDSTLKLWDLKDDGNMFKTLNHCDREWVMCCDWSPDAKWVASGGTTKEIYVWRAETWTLHRKLSRHLHNVSSCKFSCDNALLASCSYDTSIILWDYVNGEIMSIIWHMIPPPRLIFASGDNEHFVRHVSFSPDGDTLASVCDDGFVRIWNIYASASPTGVSEVQNALCASYSADGHCLAVGTRDGTAHLFAPCVQVRSLARMCRSVIRRYVGSDAVERLMMPTTVKTFLLYKDLQPQSTKKRSSSYCGQN